MLLQKPVSQQLDRKVSEMLNFVDILFPRPAQNGTMQKFFKVASENVNGRFQAS
jgi:hypothetical protein